MEVVVTWIEAAYVKKEGKKKLKVEVEVAEVEVAEVEVKKIL